MALRRGGYWGAVVASAGVLATGIVVAARAGGGPSGPSGVVQAYFAALARSDAPGALALGAAPPRSHAFLTSEVLQVQQHLAPLRDVVIDAVDGTGNVRTVSYSYVLDFPTGPRAVTGTVGVVRQDADWRLASSAVPVHPFVAAASSRATLAGAAVPDGVVALFPGAVPVRFDTPLLRTVAAVTFGSPRELTVEVAVSDRGRAQVSAAVAARIARCVPAASAPSCPLPDDPRVVPGSLRGTIETGALNGLHYEVESLASGPIAVGGTLPFRGRYERLDDDNIARARSGELALQLRATTPSVGAVRLRFVGASS